MDPITEVQINGTRLELVQGDITHQEVDAIVNAANESLLGGGGVDGAIHAAAGPELLAECRTLNGCPTGEARLTGGYRLPAKHIIHTVGPVYFENPQTAPQYLASAHRNSLHLAHEYGLKRIAFPAISTGVYGYPKHEAAPIAYQVIHDYIKEHQPDFELVRFVLFDAKALDVFSRALANFVQSHPEVRSL